MLVFHNHWFSKRLSSNWNSSTINC